MRDIEDSQKNIINNEGDKSAKLISGSKNKFFAWQYAKELWGDHRFWKQVTVVKGGVGIITTGILLIPTILTMPFLLAASAVAISGILIATAAFSIGYGAIGLIETHKNTKTNLQRKFNKTSLPEKDLSLSDTRAAFIDMMLENKYIKYMAESRVIQAIGNTKSWKKFSSFMAENDNLLDTLTVKNSAASIAIFGGTLLLAQAAVLPFFIPIVFAAYATASVGLGGYMLYEGGQGVAASLKEKQDEKSQKLQQDSGVTKSLKPVSSPVNQNDDNLRLKFLTAKRNDEIANKNQPVISPVKEKKTSNGNLGKKH